MALHGDQWEAFKWHVWLWVNDCDLAIVSDHVHKERLSYTYVAMHAEMLYCIALGEIIRKKNYVASFVKKKLNWHLSCSTPRLCSVQIHKTGLLLHMLMYSKVLLLRYYYLRQSTMRERPDVLYCIYFVSGHLDLQTQLHFFFFMTKTYFLILIKMFSLFVCVLNLQLHFFFFLHWLNNLFIFLKCTETAAGKHCN